MGSRIVGLLMLAGVTLAEPALAQSGTAGRVIDALTRVMANAKSRGQVAAVSKPLAYDSEVPAADPADVTDPRNVEVAGLRLGMTLSEARAALRRSGFNVNADGERKEYSFAMSALPNANANLPMDVRQLDASGRGGQRLTVKFMSLPQGAAVDRVEFTAPTDAMSQEAFLAQLGGRYGEAELVHNSELVWCVGQPGVCADDFAWQRQPFLSASAENRSILLVYNDPARDNALEARLNELRNPRPAQMERADF